MQKQNSKDSSNPSVAVDQETEMKLEKQRQKIINDRIKVLINHLKTYGIPEKYIFEIGDLMDLANVPKVTRCIAMMAKMVSRPTQACHHVRDHCLLSLALFITGSLSVLITCPVVKAIFWVNLLLSQLFQK